MPVVTATAHAPVAPPPLDANAGMDAPAAIARNKSICKMRQVSTNSDVLNHECWFDMYTYTYSLLLLAALPVLKLAIANFPISMYYLQFWRMSIWMCYSTCYLRVNLISIVSESRGTFFVGSRQTPPLDQRLLTERMTAVESGGLRRPDDYGPGWLIIVTIKCLPRHRHELDSCVPCYDWLLQKGTFYLPCPFASSCCYMCFPLD